MSTNNNYGRLSILIILLILNYSCFCIAQESNNATTGLRPSGIYYPAVATWYGSPTGAGSSGGACGLADDVSNDPYFGFISAGNNYLFKAGAGCGTCYEVKCTYKDNPACLDSPIRVTITDQCPGTCNDDGVHFNLSGIAFGYLARSGLADSLRQAGRINLQYRRVKCHYKANIKFKIDSGSNKYYLAFVVENLNGYGDIAHIEVLPFVVGAHWMPAKNSWGVTWKLDLPAGLKGPYSVRITGPENTTSVTAYNVIPNNWTPGAYYYSNVNF